jgi:outer membrane protein assembly factor BamD
MRNIFVLIFTAVLLGGCAGGKKSINKILKSTDPEYKLRMAEQFFVKKKYSKAQAIYEDIMPYYRHLKEFEDIYYKYAYSAYYQQDYLNAENLFKTFLELFPNSPKADELDYMRAYTYYKQSPRAELDQTDTEKAIGLFQIFINTHPNSPRNKEAYEIIEKLRAKLEVKAYKAAQLYYDLGQFRAAGVSFTNVLNTFPESSKADEYKLMIIRSYFRYAELSIEEKKVERFEQVITECNEFNDRFPESKLSKEVERFLNQSNNNLKILNNEQVKTPA